MSDPVLDLLNKQQLSFTVSGKDYLIKCLNKDHEDNNPSFRVDKLTGIAHCFGCGFKTNIFKFYGITQNFSSIKLAKLKQKLKDLNISTNGIEFPESTIPYNRTFRSISTQTLKEFGAFYTDSGEKYIDRIFFPITDVRGKNVVFVGRHTLSNGNPRYLNVPSGVQIPIFPAAYKTKYKTCILVEGIFDLLNLYDNGIHNVSCTFGTNTLQKDTALKLLGFKTQGITKIFLMFDGDTAGRDAMKVLKPLIEDCGFEVEIIKLEEDTDPGNMSKEDIHTVKEYINA